MKLAVFFPGVGYHLDKPLLYYSKKLAVEAGYEIKELPYSGFPTGIKGDKDKMRQVFESGLSQTEDMLKDVDFSIYEDVVFISKSLGSVIAGAYAKKHELRPRMIVYTPVAQSFDYLWEYCGEVFHGSNDAWVSTNIVKEGCNSLRLPLHVIKDANHSLETGEVMADLVYISEVMRLTADILRKG